MGLASRIADSDKNHPAELISVDSKRDAIHVQPELATSGPEGARAFLQNISVPAPTVSLFPPRLVDGRKSSIEPCKSLDNLRVTYITETNQRVGPGIAADEHTIIVHTINDFISLPSFTSGVFGPECEVVHHGSQDTYPDIAENDSMTQSEPWLVSGTVL